MFTTTWDFYRIEHLAYCASHASRLCISGNRHSVLVPDGCRRNHIVCILARTNLYPVSYVWITVLLFLSELPYPWLMNGMVVVEGHELSTLTWEYCNKDSAPWTT